MSDIQTFKRGRDRLGTWIFKQSTPRARKEHTCHCCQEPITKGTRYVTFVTNGVEGPGFETWRLHGECYLSGEPMFYGKRPDWRWGDEC